MIVTTTDSNKAPKQGEHFPVLLESMDGSVTLFYSKNVAQRVGGPNFKGLAAPDNGGWVSPTNTDYWRHFTGSITLSN